MALPLKLYIYRGRDSGLMVVGSREAMAELTSRLSGAIAKLPPASTAEWPPELVSAPVQVGPYTDSQHWQVSFHVEGSVPSERKALVARSGPPAWLSLVTLALAAVGVVSLLRMVWNAF